MHWKERLISWLKPSAFKLGFLITLFFYIYAKNYYIAKGSGNIKKTATWSFNAAVEDLHQKSIDLKLLARGPRHGSDEVVLLAIDDLSVEKMGRWPWPRTYIAQMIEELMEYKAQTIAFDVIFSEPDSNQAFRSLNRLKQHPEAKGSVLHAIEEELAQANTDDELTQSLEKYGNHVVMGAYFDNLEYELLPFQDKCMSLAYSSSKESQYLANETAPIAALDEVETELPESVLDFLSGNFDQIADTIKEKDPHLSEIDFKKLWRDQTSYFCANWLFDNDPSLENLRAAWPDIQEEDEISEDFETWREQTMGRALKNQVPMSGRLWLNLDIFSEQSKHTGYFNAFQDPDGTIRRNYLVYRYGYNYLPALGLKTVMNARNYGLLINVERNPYDPFQKGISRMSFTDENGAPSIAIPVDSSGALPINYAGPSNMFPYLSFHELLNQKETMKVSQRGPNGQIQEFEVSKKDWIQNKIFFVGATALGIYDLRVTPFEENYPGPETHVNIIDNLLRQDFLKIHEDEPPYMLATMLALGCLLSLAISYLGALSGLLISIVSLTAVIAIDFYLLFLDGWIVCVVLPIFLVSSLYIFLTFFKYLTEERMKKELKGTFQKYVSPAIVEEVLKDPKNLQLGGRKERMTVLFSDIRGFTTISEKLDPSALSDLLNSYLTPMTDLVFKHDGTLDKYMGDAVMAFFGAPINYPNHAEKGVLCALEMLETLKLLQVEYQRKNLPPIDIGIGLNTGEMSVGNMGSETVRSYTVMGDAVNLGSRLEGINKEYGTRIIISEFTFRDLSDEILCREIDWVKVKGKLEPVKIYEVVNLKARVSESKAACVSYFQQGFELYHQQSFQEALLRFQEALKKDPEDGPSELYVRRTLDYLESPPDNNWDGVYTMTTK